MEKLNQNGSSWNQNVKNLGIVTPGTPYKVEFIYTGEKKIKVVNTSCGCTVADWDGGNSITVEYKPKTKPEHMDGPQEVTKTVVITFKDTSREVLEIVAIVE